MPTSTLTTQDFQFRYQVPQGIWRWTTRVDTSLSTPVYQIRDVVSPFGLLRDSVPIPGEVVQAMATSISDLKTNFRPAILLSPTGLSFTYDEGRGFSPSQTVQLTNTGPYGSLLGVSITAADPFVRAAPPSLGNLASNETGAFEVSITTTSLVATSSPYASVLTLQDPNASNSPVTIPITVIVRPMSQISASPTVLDFFVTAPPGGNSPFPPIPVQQFIIQNLGASGAVLEYQVSRLTGCTPWLLSYTPASGELAASALQAVTVVIQPPIGTSQGSYQETLRVSGYSTNSYQDVLVRLTVF